VEVREYLEDVVEEPVAGNENIDQDAARVAFFDEDLEESDDEYEPDSDEPATSEDSDDDETDEEAEDEADLTQRLDRSTLDDEEDYDDFDQPPILEPRRRIPVRRMEAMGNNLF
jgi:hypothetical protein